MPPLRKKRPPKRVTATIHFRHAKNEKGNRQLCVYAECDLGGTVVGPIWGHNEQSVKKSASTLTRECDCPAKFHRAQEYLGKRILNTARRKP